jgi:uroporphyrinogen III methyltransferase/synthase
MIRPTTDSLKVVDALARLAEYDWIAFTSRNAVRVVFDWLRERDRLPIPRLRVAAVGPATSDELQRREVTVDCVAPEANARGLALALSAVGVSGASVLLPLGDLAGDEIRTLLEHAGARVTLIRVYETAPAQPTESEAREVLLNGQIDVVTLASPSAFRNLVAMGRGEMDDVLRHTHLVVIGPTSAEAVRAAGFDPSAIAERQTSDGLVDAILGLYTTEQ